MMRWPVAAFAFAVSTATALAQPTAPDKSASDTPLTITLRKRASLGGAADASFTPTVLFAGDVASDARGRLYLLDRAESVVHVYESNGKPVSKIGHKGGGPGEFTQGRQLGVASDGSVIVSDNGKRAFVRFDASGKVLPEQSMRGLGTLQRILWTNGKLMVLEATINDSTIMMRFDEGKIERLAVLAPVPKKPTSAWEPCGLAGSSSAPLLSERLIAGASQNVLVTNRTSTFSLAVHEAGKPVRTLTRARVPDRLTMPVAREILGDSQSVYIGSNGRRCAVPTEAIAKEAGLAPVVPTYERLIVDGNGTIWALRRGAEKKPRQVDVYDAVRGYRGTANIGMVNPVAFLSDGAVVSLETDADDAPVVRVYAVQK